MVPPLSAGERAAAEGVLGEFLASAHLDPACRAALRIDAAILQVFPELVFPCLWNRLAFSAEPNARDLLVAWRQEHERAGRAWLRALVPPRFPVGSGLVEEYRADFGVVSAVFLTESVVGAGEFAWDRRHGLRRSRDRASIPNPKATRDVPEGILGCDRDDYSRVSCVEIAAGRVFVGGCYDAYVGVVVAISEVTGEPLWRFEEGHSVTGLAATEDGRLVVAFAGDAVIGLDGATGAVRFRAPIEAAAGALTADGRTLATLAEGARVLRVWDVATLEAGPAFEPGASTRTGAWFTPDGTRVLLGNFLWDAVDGRPIAQLRGTEGGGFLEGGPPDESRALSDRYYVEFQVFRGRRVWELATGTCVIEGADGHYLNHRDRIRTSRADVFAHARDRGGVTVYDVVTHAPILAVPGDDIADFHLAPTGEWLDVVRDDGSIQRHPLAIAPIALPAEVPVASCLSRPRTRWDRGALVVDRGGSVVRVITDDPLVFNASATRAASGHPLFAWEER